MDASRRLTTCDVVIVGGGPAGSSCAWWLRRAGLDVIVIDRARFPRDKVCAGWITPGVVGDLDLDIDEYRRGRTFQPITGFKTGLIEGRDEVETAYGRPVSYGIRRCEFDQYLLQRSGARLMLGMEISSLRREGSAWILNDSIRAPMLVGAGGHFCPVARLLNARSDSAPVVVAQEAEFAIPPTESGCWKVATEIPELYFCSDASGYGWCFRKGDYINIGLGRLDRHSLPKACQQFVAFLRRRFRIPEQGSWRWRGHAYLISDPPHRRRSGDGVMLIGDAAGLAYPQSGEGIRPAIESGLLAASAILNSGGNYTSDRTRQYESLLHERFRVPRETTAFASPFMPAVKRALMPWLFHRPWFVRHLVLDRWFLRAGEPPLSGW